MTVTEVDDVEDDRHAAALPLTVKVGTTAHTVDPAETPVVIGRDDPNAEQRPRIPVTDSRISRRHLIVDLRGGHWVGIPEGRNGVYLNGLLTEGPFTIPEDGLTVVLGDPASGIPIQFSTLDPAVVYVGAQVARRRDELDLSQRTLAANKVINAGVLISLEKGRSWPRQKTQRKLEEALGWPAGHITQLRRDHHADAEPAAGPADGERTEVLAAGGTTTVDATYMAATVELALAGIRAQVEALPPPSDPAFQPRVRTVLADLSRLEGLARNASRGTQGAADVIVQLSAVRRARRDLMLRAAASPGATLGQRVFAARSHAELTIEEAAAMAGLPTEDVAAAEAGQTLDDARAEALRRLLTALR